MRDRAAFYVDGRWVPPAGPRTLEVINPATESVAGVILLREEFPEGKSVCGAVHG